MWERIGRRKRYWYFLEKKSKYTKTPRLGELLKTLQNTDPDIVECSKNTSKHLSKNLQARVLMNTS